MTYRYFVKLFIAYFIFSISSFSQISKTSNQKVDSLLTLAKQKINSGDIDCAQSLLVDAQNFFTTDAQTIRLNYHQAIIYVENENDGDALEILLEGYSNLENIENSSHHSNYTESIGRIFSRAKNFEKALQYFRLSRQHAEQRNDSLAISSAYLNAGSVFQIKNELDSTAYYYLKVIQNHPKIEPNLETLATVYSNLIGVAVGKGDFELAKTYGLKSLEFLKEKKDTIKVAGVLSNLGSINMYTGNLEDSNDYYFKAYNLLKNRTDLKSKEVIAITLDNISQVYYLQGDYKTGYDYLFESTGVERELIKEKLENRITEIAAKYELSEEEKHTEIEKNRREKAVMWQYIFGLIVFVLLIIFWLSYRANRLKREKIDLEFQKEKVDQARKIEVMQNEVQIKILNATLDAKEAERRHIAEILHDNVSTLLSSANMHLYAVKTELKENAPVELQKIELIISEASDKVRNLSHKLVSSVLLRFGLESSIEDLCEKYSNSRLAFKFKPKNVGRYDESFELKTHNIIEELTNNIMKHSNAYNASIKMEEVDEVLKINIHDDGDGFDLKVASKKDGLGLSQIAARVKVMNGVLDIKSYENTGTQILIKLPISK